MLGGSPCVGAGMSWGPALGQSVMLVLLVVVCSNDPNVLLVRGEVRRGRGGGFRGVDLLSEVIVLVVPIISPA